MREVLRYGCDGGKRSVDVTFLAVRVSSRWPLSLGHRVTTAGTDRPPSVTYHHHLHYHHCSSSGHNHQHATSLTSLVIHGQHVTVL
ncbi:hypothetical protein J6590_075339 [Homalodisca vitripennis]|nr:hypothetical protein J6590_075339 [Homalodisca vitripennis]